MEGLHVSQVSSSAPSDFPNRSYRRSTNNSHKKFISVTRRLLLKCYPSALRQRFERIHREHKNSRCFFFILLAHVKMRMSPQQQQEFHKSFNTLLESKIHSYRDEISKSKDRQFINFRMEEIFDIQYSQTAAQLYFQGNTEAAIETLYKKDKVSVVKKQQYDNALRAVTQLEIKLGEYPPGELVPYLEHENETNGINNMGVLFERELWQDRQHEQEVVRSRRGDKQRPLASLVDSYPIYPHLYSVMFSHPLSQIDAADRPYLQPIAPKSYAGQAYEYPFFSGPPAMQMSQKENQHKKQQQVFAVKEEAIQSSPCEERQWHRWA